jgi:hypothetical protein
MTLAESEPAPDGHAMTATAAEVAVRLAGLRRVLEPTRDLWAGTTAGLGPAEEWTIAVEGLFGADGVLGQISRAMHAEWPAFEGLGWTDGDGPRPVAARARDRRSATTGRW